MVQQESAYRPVWHRHQEFNGVPLGCGHHRVDMGSRDSRQNRLGKQVDQGCAGALAMIYFDGSLDVDVTEEPSPRRSRKLRTADQSFADGFAAAEDDSAQGRWDSGSPGHPAKVAPADKLAEVGGVGDLCVGG